MEGGIFYVYFYCLAFYRNIFWSYFCWPLSFLQIYLYSNENVSKLAEEKKDEQLEELIEEHIAPIKEDLNNLRSFVLEEKKISERYIEIILASYRFRLIQLCQSFLKQGYMTSGQYEQLVEFFKVYAGLGGNGQAKEYYERTLKLPLKD